MLRTSSLNHSCEIDFLNRNIILGITILRSDDINCSSSDIWIKFDPGANETLIDYETLSDALSMNEEYIIDEGRRLNLSPIYLTTISGASIISHPVIIPEIVMGDYELRNVLVYTILNSTKVEYIKELTGIDSITVDNVDYIDEVLYSQICYDIGSVNSSDGSSRCILGQNILQHFDYDVRLEGLDIEPYESSCDEFIFKTSGKFFFDTTATSKRVFKDRYKRYIDGENDLFWMLSIEDMQEIDRNKRGKFNNINNVSALRW